MLCYWEINPEELCEKNKSKKFEKNRKKLCQVYKKNAKDIQELILKINKNNFKQVIEKIFQKEALLSEIYFYLSEGLLFESEEDIMNLVQKEYVLSYEWKLEEKVKEASHPTLLVKHWLEDM